jgi:hypothetical protein
MHWSTGPLQKLDIYVRKTNKAHAGHESVMAILACRCEEAMGSLIYWSVASELKLAWARMAKWCFRPMSAPSYNSIWSTQYKPRHPNMFKSHSFITS